MFAWLLGSGNPTPPLPAINEALPPIQPRRWPDDPSEIVTERSSSKGSRICVGVAAAQGGYRMAMEDAHAVHLDAKIAKCLSSGSTSNQHLFLVADGHGGPEAAEHAAQRFLSILCSHKWIDEGEALLALNSISSSSPNPLFVSSSLAKPFQDTFLTLDDTLKHLQNEGSTLCTALVTESTIFVANAGDSRCVLLRSSGAVPLSNDHKPSIPEESARIFAAKGGFVDCGRVQGELAVSRAIGDFRYKGFKLSGPNDPPLVPPYPRWNPTGPPLSFYSFTPHPSKSSPQSKSSLTDRAPGFLLPKNQPVTAFPDVFAVHRQNKLTVSSSSSNSLHICDRFLVLACDGIWDVMTNEDVFEFIIKRADEEALDILQKAREAAAAARVPLPSDFHNPNASLSRSQSIMSGTRSVGSSIGIRTLFGSVGRGNRRAVSMGSSPWLRSSVTSSSLPGSTSGSPLMTSSPSSSAEIAMSVPPLDLTMSVPPSATIPIAIKGSVPIPPPRGNKYNNNVSELSSSHNSQGLLGCSSIGAVEIPGSEPKFMSSSAPSASPISSATNMSVLSKAEFHHVKGTGSLDSHSKLGFSVVDAVPGLALESNRSSETSTPSNDLPMHNVRSQGDGGAMVTPPILPRSSTPVPFTFDFLALAEDALERICKQLIKEVIRKDSRDNMTLLVVAFPDAFHPSFGESLESQRKINEQEQRVAAASDEISVTGVFEEVVA